MRRVTKPSAYRVAVTTEDNGRKHVWRVEELNTLDPMLPLFQRRERIRIAEVSITPTPAQHGATIRHHW